MSESSGGRWEFDQDGNVHYVPPEGQESSGTQSQTNNYHYEYTYNYNSSDNPRPSRASHRSAKSNDTGWHWIFIVLGFMIFWPVGLILLFLEIGGKWPGNQQVERELRRAGSAAKAAAKQVKISYEASQKAQQSTKATGKHVNISFEPSQGDAQGTTQRAAGGTVSAKQQKKQAKKRKKEEDGAAYGLGHIKLLRTVGGILAGLFGFAFIMNLIDEITYFYSMGFLLEETVPLLALCLAGVALLGMAGSRKRKLKKFRKYLSMIGDRDEAFIPALAKAMGVSEKKASQELEEMLDRGFFEGGYIDAARQSLVLREGGIWEAPAPEPEEPESPEKQDDLATGTLQHIRQVNDAIANPELSQKIDRIEELTAKIFRLLEERPEKASELRSFMNYYLPQTLKILENYSKLEAQGIEGENIAEAKQKIEGMMDKLVDGYETQLDKLFADDVLDISADLKVMENMLEKDGLTLDNELRL